MKISIDKELMSIMWKGTMIALEFALYAIVIVTLGVWAATGVLNTNLVLALLLVKVYGDGIDSLGL
ncbi:MAG: hypothetical protein KAJ73_02305 [Zetaproteobacteria bacterium]|nr:hypothetical protein [Zetaproteobacteria bacterium]